MKGLRATAPAAAAAATAMEDASTLLKLNTRKSPRAQRTMTGVTVIAPAASRSHQTVQREITLLVRYPAADKLPTPTAALIVVVERTMSANLPTSVGESKVLRPWDQMLIK